MIVGEQLTIEVRQEHDRIVLTLHGELDLLGAPRLQSEIESDTVARPTSSCSTSTTSSSSTPPACESSSPHTSARWSAARELALTPGSPQVQRLFSIAGVSGHLHTIASANAALV